MVLSEDFSTLDDVVGLAKFPFGGSSVNLEPQNLVRYISFNFLLLVFIFVVLGGDLTTLGDVGLAKFPFGESIVNLEQQNLVHYISFNFLLLAFIFVVLGGDLSTLGDAVGLAKFPFGGSSVNLEQQNLVRFISFNFLLLMFIFVVLGDDLSTLGDVVGLTKFPFGGSSVNLEQQNLVRYISFNFLLLAFIFVVVDGDLSTLGDAVGLSKFPFGATFIADNTHDSIIEDAEIVMEIYPITNSTQDISHENLKILATGCGNATEDVISLNNDVYNTVFVSKNNVSFFNTEEILRDNTDESQLPKSSPENFVQGNGNEDKNNELQKLIFYKILLFKIMTMDVTIKQMK
ncbi:hypothetical protein FQA39_LY09841 [Lamprigera yunnana]|nr:hypothetical protein FQA39_LY09841 [Lamprigera yunnana]